MKLLRHPKDKGPVAYLVLLFMAQCWACFTLSLGWAALFGAVSWFFLSFAGAYNHHHQHVNVFVSPWLNRCFEMILFLQTGIGSYTWVLHHNLGHHVHYLNQFPIRPTDESHWTRPDGSQMSRIEYTVHLALTAPLDIWRVGRRHPRVYRRYLWMRLPMFSIYALLLATNAHNTLVVFLLPSLAIYVATCAVTYQHHAGLRGENHFDSCHNILDRFYNFRMANLGYHTAHHYRPGVHWSELPRLHAQIEHQIPAHCLQGSASKIPGL